MDKTLASYLGEVSMFVAWLADTGIAALTSGNDIEFETFDEKPTALFIKIPDAIEHRHKLVSILIVQMYKALVFKAGDNKRRDKTQNEELLRTAYFILDEFGNLPKLNKIDSIITVGRSRKIFLVPIIQDFKQLSNKYGKDTADIIKSNCNIKIFIQAGDIETTREFSELCGKHKVKRVSMSESKDVSVSTSVEERPLISPNELQNLNDANSGRMGNAIVLATGKAALKAKFTPCFQAPEIYKMRETKIQDMEPIKFSEREFYYDIKTRRDKVKTKQDDSINMQFDLGFDMPDGFDESQIDSREIFLAELERKLKNLEPALSKKDFKILVDADLVRKIELLEEFIAQAVERRNNFLKIQAAFVKDFIARRCLGGGHERTG
jgi:type IV secretion system protein VirD4